MLANERRQRKAHNVNLVVGNGMDDCQTPRRGGELMCAGTTRTNNSWEMKGKENGPALCRYATRRVANSPELFAHRADAHDIPERKKLGSRDAGPARAPAVVCLFLVCLFVSLWRTYDLACLGAHQLFGVNEERIERDATKR